MIFISVYYPPRANLKRKMAATLQRQFYLTKSLESLLQRDGIALSD